MTIGNFPSAVKSVARSTGLAKLYRTVVRTPLNTVRQSIREGGPIEQWRTQRGKEAMREAATELPPLDPPPEDSEGPLRVYFLTGEDFWYQTLFCFVSLQRHCEVRATPVIYGDGTLHEDYRHRIRRVVPWVEFVTSDEVEERLDVHLPASRYPTLRKRRIEYAHLRKLTDFHVGSSNWKLILDSDMLFFDTPSLLINWLRAPQRPIHMIDAGEFYGYSRQLMEELAGAEIPKRLNVGICGLQGDMVEWSALERWCREMNQREHVNYLQEQALTAMLMAGRERIEAPRPEYLTKPSVGEGHSPSVTLHHYVSESKRAYFQHGWRHTLQSLNGESASTR